ncbi:hypothetical protein B0H14DRAFT_2467358 [Mycena olivaceomarginata]|nr:hypothetical protein B0H14DRAFT_2467358 [Mycena olivaceomarginata]
MLSGIGDREQLSEHGIKPIVHLPGVGTNLQDHDEVSNIWTLKKNHTLFDGVPCSTPPRTTRALNFGSNPTTRICTPRRSVSHDDVQKLPRPPRARHYDLLDLGYFPGFSTVSRMS